MFWLIFFETSEDDIETVATLTAKQQYHMRDDEIEEYTKKPDPKKSTNKFFLVSRFLLRNKGSMCYEKLQSNASKFNIFLEYENPHSFFFNFVNSK